MSLSVLLLILLIIGINFVFVGFFVSLRSCPPAKVEYRFIPRTFNEEMEAPVSVIDQLQSVFDDKSLLT
jgi:hypothetical protein